MKFQIKAAREKAGFSQKELAKIVGVAPSTFNGYESGNHDPKSELLCKIADTCDVTVDFLLGRNFSDDTHKHKNSPSTDESAPGEEKSEDDSLRSTLLHNFDQLNQEGQERLVETSDDMVSSGKYIKSNPDKLGNEKYA